MKEARAPNYRLRENHEITLRFGLNTDKFIFEQGTFVRPVERRNLAKHLLEDREIMHMNDETHVACYTRFGMHVIPRSKLEAVQ